MKDLKFAVALSKFLFVGNIIITALVVLLVALLIVAKEISFKPYAASLAASGIMWFSYFLLKNAINKNDRSG